MPIAYLRGVHWDQITREERFFCSHLYHQIQQGGIPDFIRIIKRCAANPHNAEGLRRIQAINENQEWELGFEVCFYRDYQFHFPDVVGRYSPKRTFDLCLLGEQNLIVIEAKAFEGFAGEDLETYGRDKAAILQITTAGQHGFLDETRILIIALVPSWYSLFTPVFDGIIRWNDLSLAYNNDALLRCADRIYRIKKGDPERATAWPPN